MKTVVALLPRVYSRYLQALFRAWTWWLGPAGGNKRPWLWPSSAPSRGSRQGLILLCQPLLITPLTGKPLVYTSAQKMGQYLCGMRNNNNALWECFTGAEKGGGPFIRNKSFTVFSACVENLWWLLFFHVKVDIDRCGSVEREKFCSNLIYFNLKNVVCMQCVTCITYIVHGPDKNSCSSPSQLSTCRSEVL